MPFSILMLLSFTAWTLLLLLGTIGCYRWFHILTGKKAISTFSAEHVEGADWYKRAMRAHANCLENLPIFACIVFALYVTKLDSPFIDNLTLLIVISRILQSLTHVCLPQSNKVVVIRFIFFFAQLLSFLMLLMLLFQTSS